MNSIKICHLTSAHYHDDTRIFVKECCTLAAAGYETHLVAPGAPDEIHNGVHLHGISKLPSSRLVRMTRTMQAIYRQALSIDADIYHFHDPELITVGLLLTRQGKRVIYDIHEDVPRQILQKEYLPRCSRRLASLLMEHLERVAGQRFSALVVATSVIGNRFQSINPRTVVINNYPLRDELVAVPPIPWKDRPQSVAYIGGLTTERGMFEMVEAIGLVSKNFQAMLELAGDIWPVSRREQLMQLAGWSRVRELGWLNRLDVSALLGRVRAGLVVLQPTNRYMVSQPIKLFEYMSAGIPVIASDFPLWRSFVIENNCGLLVNPLDPGTIARAIEFILVQPQAAEEMGRRGREAVAQYYHWEAEAPRLIQLYQEIAGLS